MALYSKTALRGILTEQYSQVRKSRSLSERAYTEEVLSKARDFDEETRYDIFLAHSFADEEHHLISALVLDLNKLGYTVYVDWLEDPELDRSRVTAKNAARIRKRIRNSQCMLYVYSENVKVSRWAQWELGFCDGAKKGRAAILPITDRPQTEDDFKGVEFLGLYPYVSKEKIANSNKTALWINRNPETFVKMQEWLEGKNPIPRK